MSRQIAWLAFGCAGLLLVTLAVAAAWSVERIDQIAKTEQQTVIASGLSQIQQRLAVEQDGAVHRDDAVLRLRANDQDWLAKNVVDWLSAFYGHDRVYVVGPDGAVVRAASDGRYAGHRLDPLEEMILLPRIARFRTELAAASFGQADSTAAIAGMGLSDTAKFFSGEIGFISIRPVLPSSTALTQAPGAEYLIVSVQFVDNGLLAGIADNYGIDDLHLNQGRRTDTSVAILDAARRIIGWVDWTPRRPAMALAEETAPASVSLLLIATFCMIVLIVGLRRTSLRLEKSEARTAYLAFHDPLTGAANRTLFDTRLREALDLRYLSRTKVALIAIDLDNFKEVNDTFGHVTGDQLIRQVVKRLLHRLTEEATIARLGGDEFAIVQPGIVSDGQARWICQDLLNVFDDPFLLSSGPLDVTASLGVALEYGSEANPEEMLRRADVALYAAKLQGRNRFEIHDEDMDRQRRERRELEGELRQALDTRTGLFLVYQPIFDAETRAIRGAEALVRWHHPERGHMAPDSFIAVAEGSGLINALGMWVLGAALETCRTAGLPWVAVNVSPIQFRDPLLADDVLRMLERHQLTPDRLELEITEGVLLQNSPQVQSTIARLRQAGIRIALDDFGTGYSSISYLRHYAVDKLKIDQSFIRLLGTEPAIPKIVQSIIELGHAMDMGVTAEGVEHPEQLAALRTLGCDLVQGYLLSRPITAEKLLDLTATAQLASPAA